MSLYFRKGLRPLLLPSEPPTPVPGTSLAARGRERPGSREPRWDGGAQAASPLSPRPRPPRSPHLQVSAAPRPRLISRPPPRTPTPSRVPRPPRPPAPPARALLCPAHCPGSRCWGPGRAGGVRAGGWSPPAAHRSLGNAGKARAMLARPAGTQRRRGSPGGATAGEGGPRQQAGLAAPGWREVSGRSHGKPSPCAVPQPFYHPSFLFRPHKGCWTRRVPRVPQTSPLGSSAKPTAPGRNRPGSILGSPRSAFGYGWDWSDCAEASRLTPLSST